MQTVEEQVLNKIKNHSRGKIFFIDDFMNLGSNDALRQALFRLENEDELVRLGMAGQSHLLIRAINQLNKILFGNSPEIGIDFNRI